MRTTQPAKAEAEILAEMRDWRARLSPAALYVADTHETQMFGGPLTVGEFIDETKFVATHEAGDTFVAYWEWVAKKVMKP